MPFQRDESEPDRDDEREQPAEERKDSRQFERAIPPKKETR